MNGFFTINSKGDKVVFAKGNLRYHPKNGEWQLAEHQWDIVGAGNANVSRKYNGWIDLYVCGSGKNPTSTSDNPVNYYEKPLDDWSVNKIVNGGNQKNLWRTLTRDEWDYILNKRQTASGWSYVRAEVNGIKGAIILPDDWPSASYGFKRAKDRYDNAPNVISLQEWESVFEIAGAVFLPMAGTRYKNKYYDDGGYYWSTGYDAVVFDGNTFDSRTKNYDLLSVESYDVYYGAAVRPVRDF